LKLRMSLLELVVLFAPENQPFNGPSLRRKRKIMERFNLCEEDLPRLRQALIAGRYRLFCKGGEA